MFGAREGAWSASISLIGAAIWATCAALAGQRHAPLGIIELLFLFALLVIVPLGLELARTLDPQPRTRLSDRLHLCQPLAAIAACTAFWIPPGRISAAFAFLWFLECVLLALSRVVQCQRSNRALVTFILGLAYADLALGSAWFVVSRAGARPMGFQEPIVLLTAVHFHYSGFATAVIAAVSLQAMTRSGLRLPGLRALILLVVMLPFVVAAGFVFSPFLRFVAALAFEASLVLFAGIVFWFANGLRSRPARMYLRIACCAVGVGLAVASVYAASEFLGKDWITVPAMANSHGLLNGLGFVLLAMLAWLAEMQETAANRLEGPPRQQKRFSGAQSASRIVEVAHARRDTQGYGPELPVPAEFVAHDFSGPIIKGS